MTEWLKRLRGYVRIRVWGFAPQRFINLCSNKGILLWNIRKQNEDTYTMCISLKAFYQLRSIARKTKVRVVISERYGLPFFLPKLQKRKAFLAGLLLAIAFWMISSLFVWDIGVSGNCQVTDDMIFQLLEQEGIRKGMYKKNLEIGELEKQIRRSFPQITWISGRLTGTRLQLEIKENDVPVPKSSEEVFTTGQDLVSEYDGVIVDMIVRSGVPKVMIGSSVAKGDILVDGKIPIVTDDGTVREYRQVAADADILLEHAGHFRIFLHADYIQKKYTGRKKVRYFLRLGDREWKQEKKISFLHYDSIRNTCRLKLTDIFGFDVVWGKITYREYQKTEYCRDQEEAEEILRGKISDFLESLDEKGVQIISKNVKIETKRAGWTARGELLLREEAGKLVDSAVEDVPEPETEDLDRNED